MRGNAILALLIVSNTESNKMKRFIVHTRSVPGQTKSSEVPTILEVEGEVISALEDSSVQWLPTGEFRFRIDKPEWLSETQEIKKPDGTKHKVLVHPVYHSHSIYYTEAQALVVAEGFVKYSFNFDAQKHQAQYSMSDVLQRLKEIKIIYLSV